MYPEMIQVGNMLQGVLHESLCDTALVGPMSNGCCRLRRRPDLAVTGVWGDSSAAHRMIVHTEVEPLGGVAEVGSHRRSVIETHGGSVEMGVYDVLVARIIMTTKVRLQQQLAIATSRYEENQKSVPLRRVPEPHTSKTDTRRRAGFWSSQDRADPG